MDDIDIIKQDIIKICSEFDKEKLISVLNFLQNEHMDKKNINQNHDGIRINLDNLSNELNNKLFNFIKFKLNEDIKK
jgi:transcriptional regulator of heat shock response